ncbi:MAG: DUF5723 family protein [Candidatus Azobacteroides sp.]|nr:DUF5723 family protein [Candidatus Azobacteroides sp.]
MNDVNFFTQNIKTFLFIAGLCFTFHSTFAQSSNTEYFMSSSFTKTFTNPAKRPEKGYVGIPALTNVAVDLKTNTLNLDNFLFPGVGENGKTGWFLNENVSYDDFMENISSKNYLGVNVDYTILGAGFYVKDLFLSFDISARANAGINLPKDLFDFAKTGFATGEEAEKVYNLSNLRANANAFTQIGFGGSYPFLDSSLTLGAKIKVLLGVAHADFNLDEMRIQINDNVWKASTQASGVMIIPTVQVEYDKKGKVRRFNTDGSFSFVNGWGLGLDLGATFKPSRIFNFTGDFAWLDKLTISAALTDIGFISWNKNKMISLTTNPQELIVTGNHTIDINESDNLFKDIRDNLEDAVAFYPSTSSKTTSGLGAKLNWGMEFALMKDQLNIGFLNTAYFNPVKTISEFTIAGAYRPLSGVEVGLSYSFVHSSFQTIGFALHLGPCFYISSDYAIPHVNSQFIPTSSQAFNVQFGFAIPIGKKHQ